MRRLLIAVLVVLLIIAGGVAYLFLNDPEDVDPELPTATPAPQSRIFGVDTETTTLAFSLDLGGGTIDGTFDITDGTLLLVPAEDGWKLQVNLIVEGQTVETGSSIRNQLLIIALKAKEYPYGVYTGLSEEIITDPEEEQEVLLVGEIELSGIQNPQNGLTTMKLDGDLLTADTRLDIDFTDFGADFSALGASNIMAIDLHIEARADLAPEEPLDLDEFSGETAVPGFG
ncbi:MAG: YceI family protein [Chloroflexi bacterium]|nr:YceI family protein [Chloroflexota bacterium]